MGSLKYVFAALSVVPVMLFAALPAASAAGSGGAGTSAAPLIVKIATVDGKKRLKVKKKLKLLASCSTDCVANVTLTLKTPASNPKFSRQRTLGAGDIWTTGIVLTRYGRGYLKKNFRRSILKVVVRAVDSGTGKRVVKTKYFRFFR